MNSSSTCSSRKSSQDLEFDPDFQELFENINNYGLDLEQVNQNLFVAFISWCFQVLSLKRCFDQCSDKESATVDLKYLPTLLRMMNIQPSNLDHVTRSLPHKNKIDFEAFVEIASKFLTEEDEETTKYELKEAFRWSHN